MSILHVDLKMPGGMYVHPPSFVTTTLVGYVPSKASSALKQIVINKLKIWLLFKRKEKKKMYKKVFKNGWLKKSKKTVNLKY